MLNSFQLSILSFLFGVGFHSIYYNLEFNISVFHYIAFVSGIFIVIFYVYSRINSLLAKVFIFVLFFALGVLRFHASLPEYQDIPEPYYAYIVSEPEHQKDNQRFVAQLLDASYTLSSTKIMVSTDSFSDLMYGDLVVLKGKIIYPEDFFDPRGKLVRYGRILASRGVSRIMRNAKVEIKDSSRKEALNTTSNKSTQELALDLIKKPWHISFIEKLYSIKYAFLEVSYQKIPEPESGLLAGILYGKLDALSWSDEEVFRRVGLMHIVVLSGYNVTIIIEVMVKTLRFLNLRTQSLVAIVAVILFALLVGGGPTVVRASAMAIVLLLARLLGRKYNLWRSMLMVLFFLVLQNPYVLVYSLSFQLSFLATIGIVLWHPIMLWYTRKIPNILEFRESLATTLSAQIMVSPLILYAIGDFSLIAPIINAIVLFAVPIAMFLGFLSSFSYIAEIFSPLAYLSLHYIMEVARFGSGLPNILLEAPKFSWTLLFCMYFGIYLWYQYENKKSILRNIKV